MLAATLLYLVSYLVFSFSTKWLALPHPDTPPVDGLTLLPASMLCCAVVWMLGLLVEAAVTSIRLRLQHNKLRLDVVRELRSDGVYVTTGPHDYIALPLYRGILPLLFTRDVLVAATASAAILISSTLAYSRAEVSLLLPLLLMKGGVNLWGPVVSWLRGDGVTARARVVLGLALVAVVAVLWDKVSLHASFAVTITVAYAAVYVAAYFPKLEVISRYRGNYDFLMAEMTSTLIVALPVAVVVGWAHSWRGLGSATTGFYVLDVLRSLAHAVAASTHSTAALLQRSVVWVMALASEGAGLFGGVVFFARVSSTLSVPLNRCTSLIAGVAATAALWSLTHDGGIVGYLTSSRNRPELVGVAVMMVALWIGLGGGSRVAASSGQRAGGVVAA